VAGTSDSATGPARAAHQANHYRVEQDAWAVR
jgi:hypothetical protein